MIAHDATGPWVADGVVERHHAAVHHLGEPQREVLENSGEVVAAVDVDEFHGVLEVARGLGRALHAGAHAAVHAGGGNVRPELGQGRDVAMSRQAAVRIDRVYAEFNAAQFAGMIVGGSDLSGVRRPSVDPALNRLDTGVVICFHSVLRSVRWEWSAE